MAANCVPLGHRIAASQSGPGWIAIDIAWLVAVCVQVAPTTEKKINSVRCTRSNQQNY